MAGGCHLFVDVGLMLVEGRVVERGSPRGHREGPHCPQQSPAVVAASSVAAVASTSTTSTSTAPASPALHQCSDNSFLCERASKLKRHMSLLSDNSVPMCIDVFLCPDCSCGRARALASNICALPSPTDLLIEQWTVSIAQNKGSSDTMEVDGKGLLQAIRSQLHFSQLSSWYSLGIVKPVCYRLSHPGTAASLAATTFTRPPIVHNFPTARAPRGSYVKVSLKSLPRLEGVTNVSCPVHSAGPSPLSATVTVLKSVSAELGHCLLDPPSRVPPPPIKHGLGNWRDNRTPSPPPLLRSQQSTSSSRVSGGMAGGGGASRHPRHIPPSHYMPTGGLVDDRLQSGCQHIGKHHCQDDSLVEPPSSPTLSRSNSHGHHQQLYCTPQGGGGCSKDVEAQTVKYLSCGYNEGCSSSGGNTVSLRCSPPLPPGSGTVITVYRSEVSCKPVCVDTSCCSCDAPLTLKSPQCGGCCGHPPFPLHPSHLLNPAGSCGGCSNTNPLKRKRHQMSHNSKKLLSDQSTSFSASFSDEDSCLTAIELIDSFNSLKIGGNGIAMTSVRSKTSSIPTLSSSSENIKLCPSSPQVDSSRGVADHSSTSRLSSVMNSWSSRTPSVGVRRPQLVLSPIASLPALSPPPSPPSSLENSRRQLTDSSSEDTEECDSPLTGGCLLMSPTTPTTVLTTPPAIFFRPHRPIFGRSLPLLGTLEESILSGRLKPLSTVDCGYTADLGASGAFCPRHLTLPVRVLFYPVLGLSAPYMGVVKLSKKGYHVPRSGTIQVTLLNPLGTVIKMFVVAYDLTDMPNNSHTFLRQRTTAPPTTTLRYLIHLRFSSSKSGRLFVHTDIRMIIARQYDMDTSFEQLQQESTSQLTSVTVVPSNPKFSTKK